jgi:hypothetical protein
MCAGCSDGAVTGAASSQALPTTQSAYATVGNIDLVDPPGTYRRWEIALVEDPAGTDCEVTGDALLTIEVYTLYSSAPRGDISLSDTSQPVVLFPTAYATLPGGDDLDGTLSITAAATTQLVGSVHGFAVVDNRVVEIDATFDAPTCVP